MKMNKLWILITALVLSAAILLLLYYGAMKEDAVLAQAAVEYATAPTVTAPEILRAEETTAPPETTPVQTVPAETEPAEERFTLTFVGDCTLGSIPSSYNAGYGFVKTVGTNYGYPFQNVLDYFSSDEATFLNLEGALTDSGYPAQKHRTYRGPSAYAGILTENSVEFASLANDHTLDYGQTGYDSTVQALKNAGIPYVERDSSTIFTTANGLTIGVYGAVYYKLDAEDMVQELGALDQQCDLVIYAPHWGTEKRYQPTEEQVAAAHGAIDAGADIVWGCHPLVLQKTESYGDGLILYSMGVFSFGGNGDPDDYDTAIIQVEVVRNPDGSVSLGQVESIPCNISSISGRNNFQPTPYASGTGEYNRVLEKLAGTYKTYR